MKRLPLILILVISIMAVGFISCEKEVEKIVEAPPAIKVTQVVASDTMVTQGQMVELTATVDLEEGVDAAALEYKWFAEDGEFSHGVSTGDTVEWKAPGTDGAYKVSVHITDGENIAIGMRNIGVVNQYAPTADNYYVGDNACSGCHAGTHSNWAETGHADAWASLQTSDHAASYCEPCHTVNQVDTDGNSGYDEVPTAQFQDVQCESCHGPASEHVGSPSAETIPTNASEALSEETCGVCHEGSHHPNYSEWKESGHNIDPYTWDNGALTTFGGSCRNCHEGAIATQRLSQDDPGNMIASSPIGENEVAHGITCGVCHDPHSADNMGQLRTLAPVTLVDNASDHDGTTQETISDIGAGQVCAQCHRARRAPVGAPDFQISEGYAHFGPHPGTQTDVVYGESGYEDVVPSGEQFASSGHGIIEDACATCHVHNIPYPEFNGTAYTGHTFEPKVEACAECHGTISEFSDIMAKKDYDDDGTTEGIQVEVEGLMFKLAIAGVNADTTDTLITGLPADMSEGNASEVISAVLGAPALTNTAYDSELALDLRKGLYNLAFAEEDGSHGVHNPTYVIQLLQQSILFLDQDGLDEDAILRENKATTFYASGSTH